MHGSGCGGGDPVAATSVARARYSMFSVHDLVRLHQRLTREPYRLVDPQYGDIVVAPSRLLVYARDGTELRAVFDDPIQVWVRDAAHEIRLHLRVAPAFAAQIELNTGNGSVTDFAAMALAAIYSVVWDADIGYLADAVDFGDRQRVFVWDDEPDSTPITYLGTLPEPNRAD